MTFRNLFRMPCLAACLALAACAGAPHTRVQSGPAPVRSAPLAPRQAHAACADCGRIERIDIVAAVRATPSGGAVLGGVVGGVLSAPAPAGLAPAAPPGTARPPQRAWRIHLHMDDGRHLVVHQNLIASGIVVGARARLVQGRLVPVH